MAIFALSDVEFLVNQYNFTTYHNEHVLAYDAELLDATTFGGLTTRARRAGLLAWAGTHKGFVDHAQDFAGGTESLDSIYFNLTRVENTFITMVPEGIVEGNTAFFGRAVQNKYTTGDRVGALMPFEINYASMAPLVRGQVLQQDDVEVGAGTGTAKQLGAVSATQRLYAHLHVTAIAGGNLTVIVRSDNAVGMGTPTTQLTFTTTTTRTAEQMSVAGPITDDWYQVSFSGTFTSANFVVAVGIK